MKYSRPFITTESKDRRTMANIDLVESRKNSIRNYDDDPHREHRKNTKGLCKFCFYLAPARIGCHVMVEGACGLCNETITSTNTNIDLLCGPCGFVHEICVRCGGDQEMKVQ